MKKYILPLLLFALSFSSNATDALTRDDYPNVFRTEHFLFYFNSSVPAGDQYLPDTKRADSAPENGIPDYIEAIAAKFETAYALYTQVFKWTDPVHSKRYRGKIDYIGISIGNSPLGASTGWKPSLDVYGKPILRIKASYKNPLSKPSPEHELFHLFQHGYSLLNNAWFKEGSARWAEGAAGVIPAVDTPLPATNAAFKYLTEEMNPYDAKSFWNRLTYLCDPESPANNPASPEKTIYGAALMKTLLENLEQESEAVYRDRHFRSAKDWTYKQQSNNTDNNMYFLRAIKNAVNSDCPKKQLRSLEVNRFLSAINSQIKPFFASKTSSVAVAR